MILGNVGALYLLALAPGIILLYLLRTRSRTYEVAALFLWEGLTGDPRTRAAWIRRKIGLLLFIQLLILALVALALAGPGREGIAPHLAGMAIVLDGSASMQTRTESGATRYDLAREQAVALLAAYPTTPVALIQLSSAPQVITPLTEDHDQVRFNLATAQPTWHADGRAVTLESILTSQGGRAQFDRIVYLTDRPLPTPLPMVEERIITGGRNAGITAFTVRKDPDSQGVTAFIRVRNDTVSAYDAVVRVSDGATQVQIASLLPPGGEREYVLPFPGSRGPVFTATLEPGDDFPGDNVRYFTLHRSIHLRVRWIGERNRFLEAALRAVGDLTLIGDNEAVSADLIVAYRTVLPAEATGNILLVHAGLHGIVAIGEEIGGGEVSVVLPDDPLLNQVNPFNFRVISAPRVEVAEGGATVLELGGMPFLHRMSDEKRKVVLLSPDIMATNLPLTIDFPLLIQNILRHFAAVPAPIPLGWALVGEPISISGHGTPIGLISPSGRSLPIVAAAAAFLPQEPGIYMLTTTRGAYPLAVNIDPAESAPPIVSVAPSPLLPAVAEATVITPWWPLFAGLALLFLLVEILLYQGWLSGRRSR